MLRCKFKVLINFIFIWFQNLIVVNKNKEVLNFLSYGENYNTFSL